MSEDLRLHDHNTIKTLHGRRTGILAQAALAVYLASCGTPVEQPKPNPPVTETTPSSEVDGLQTPAAETPTENFDLIGGDVNELLQRFFDTTEPMIPHQDLIVEHAAGQTRYVNLTGIDIDPDALQDLQDRVDQALDIGETSLEARITDGETTSVDLRTNIAEDAPSQSFVVFVPDTDLGTVGRHHVQTFMTSDGDQQIGIVSMPTQVVDGSYLTRDHLATYSTAFGMCIAGIQAQISSESAEDIGLGSGDMARNMCVAAATAAAIQTDTYGEYAEIVDSLEGDFGTTPTPYGDIGVFRSQEFFTIFSGQKPITNQPRIPAGISSENA